MSDVRRQVIEGTAVIWTWQGQSPYITHEVYCCLGYVRTWTGGVLASPGSVFYTCWAGDQPSSPSREDVEGEAGAADLVDRMRRHLADAYCANKHLMAIGADPTEHTGRSDCTCSGCPAGRRSVAFRAGQPRRRR